MDTTQSFEDQSPNIDTETEVEAQTKDSITRNVEVRSSYLSVTSKDTPSTGRASHDDTIGEKVFRSRIFTIIVTIGQVLIVVPFIILAIAAISLDYNKTNLFYDPWGEKVKKATQLSPTLFPIVFAGIVGDTLVSIANYKLESRQGARLSTLEALSGSRSIMSTMTTNVKLRQANLLGLLLVLLWALSPIGGQASLRMLYKEFSLNGTKIYPYQDTAINFLNFTQADDTKNGTTVAQEMVDDIYTTSLLSDTESVLDPFGYLRIPVLNPNVTTYVSLIGIPSEVLNVERDVRLKFSFNATYAVVKTNSISINQTAEFAKVVPASDRCDSGPDDPQRQDFFFFSQDSKPAGELSNTFNNVTMYIDLGESGLIMIDMSISFQKTRVDYNCTPPNQFHSKYDGYHQYSDTCTIMDVYDEGPAYNPWTPEILLKSLPCVDRRSTNKQRVSKSISWLSSGLPYSDMNFTDVASSIRASSFDTSLGSSIAQLLNTYYWSSNGLFPNLIFQYQEIPWKTSAQTPVQIYIEVWRVKKEWAILLIISSLTLILLSILGLVIKIRSTGTEIFGFASSLTRNNPYVDVNGVSGAVSGFRRTLLLKDKVLFLADVGGVAGEPTGYIAVCDQKFKKAELTRDGVYK